MLKILPISTFKDNYVWIIVDDILKQAIVVDPGDASPVLDFLHTNGLILAAIFITHKHADHIGGITELLSQYSNVPVFANSKENVLQVTKNVVDQDKIHIENWHCVFTVLEIPGHTLGHIAYYAKPYLFCGDTLFSGGCGRVFEGTANQMLQSLKKLSSLPEDTLIYCAHEYTQSNLKFAMHIEPNNMDIQKRIEDVAILRAQNKPTLPSTIILEKKTNPFLRCQSEVIIKNIEAHCKETLPNEVDVFREMRAWKNIF